MELDSLSGGRLKRVHWQAFEQEFLQWVGTGIRPNTLKEYRKAVQRFGRFIEAKTSGLVQDMSPATVAAFMQRVSLPRPVRNQ